jgi:heparan-alpha-glucosaminide N-acetyltransferase
VTRLQTQESPERKPTGQRLLCLDAVRGLNVMLMVLVDNIGGSFKRWVDHSPWDVIHLADFVMPLFLFMVGVSMAFSMQKYSGPALKWKILSRTLKLFVIGCLTQGADIWLGGSGIDLHNMRIPGILQRIAFAYCIVAMMKLFLPVWTVVCGRVQGAVHRLF